MKFSKVRKCRVEKYNKVLLARFVLIDMRKEHWSAAVLESQVHLS